MADSLRVPDRAAEVDRLKKRVTDLERKLLAAEEDRVPFSMSFRTQWLSG